MKKYEARQQTQITNHLEGYFKKRNETKLPSAKEKFTNTMGASLESSRPIMAPSVLSSNRASQRYSTYTLAPSVSSTHTISSASVQAEITTITTGLDKLENKKLASQRFVPSAEKSGELSKLALGAKLERALGRRLGGQDAVMRKKGTKASGEPEMSEKSELSN